MPVPTTPRGHSETRAYLGLSAALMLLIVSLAVHATSGELVVPLFGAFVAGMCATWSIRAMLVATGKEDAPKA